MSWVQVDKEGLCPFKPGEFYIAAIRQPGERVVWDVNVAFMVEFSPSVYIDQDYEWCAYWQMIDYYKPLGELPPSKNPTQ